MIKRAITALAALIVAAAPSFGGTLLFDRKSPFNRVIVRQDATGLRTLQLSDDGVIQSAEDVHHPERLLEPYTSTAMAGLALSKHPRRFLFIGLGGGVMVSYVRRNYPKAEIDVVELDPVVVEAARRCFGFVTGPHTRVHVGDGRAWLEHDRGRYDVIFMDAYGAHSIPAALATHEFLERARQRLAADGVWVANVWGPASNQLYTQMLDTYRASFAELHLVRAPGGDNHIFLALPRARHLTQVDLAEAVADLDERLRPPLGLLEAVERGYETLPEPPGQHLLRDKDLR